jgi:hypothetical protein
MNSTDLREEDVSVHQRVKCACGSEVLLKNLKAHEKTKKHLNGGVVERTRPPAIVAIGETCLGTKKYTQLQKKEPEQKAPVRDQKDEAEDAGSDDDDESDQFEDIVLDDIATLSEKLDELMELVNAGFSALLGPEAMPTIEEGDEEKEETK